MKKKKTVLLTAILGMLLVGCGNVNNNSTGTNPPESVTTDTAKPSGTENITTGKSEDAPISSDNTTEPDSSLTDSSVTSEKDPYDSEWGEEIVKLMLDHLGNQLLPYVNFGRSVEATWNAKAGKLTVMGSIALSTKKLTEAHDAFTKENYTCSDVTDDSTTMTASSDTTHISVTISEDKYGYIQMEVKYDEPFDPSTASDWNSDVYQQFSDYLDGHNLPYVYLGTANNMYVSWVDGASCLVIRGGRWEAPVAEQARKAFADFQLTETTDSNGRPNLVFTKTYDDGCSLSVQVYATNSKDNPLADIMVTYSEVFDPSYASSWTDDTKAVLAKLGNHEVPFIYLGTKKATAKADSNNVVTVTGNVYKEDVITTAKEQFEKAGWETYKGSSSYGNTIYAIHTYDDGFSIMAAVRNSSNNSDTKGYNTLVLTPYSKLEVPADATDWDDAMKKTMAANLQDHLIPYTYIGATPKATVDATTKAVKITGDNFNPTMVDNYKKALEADGYTVTLSTDNNGRILNATKDFDEGTMTVNFASPFSLYSKAIITATYREKFSVPTEGGWGDTIVTSMKSALGGYEVPYFYMGTANPTMTAKIEDGQLTLVGGTWNDQIADLFKEALNKDTSHTYEYTNDGYTSSTYVVQTTTEKGDTIIATLSKTTKSLAQLELRKRNAYDSSSMTAWDDETLKAMKENLAGHIMPFVYLGSAEVTPKTSSSYLTIDGKNCAVFDTRLLDEAEKTFKADGWETKRLTNTYSPCLQGRKVFDDGYAIRFVIEKGGTGDYMPPRLVCYLDSPLLDNTKPDNYSWNLTATYQKYITDVIGDEEVPLLFLGTGSTVKASKTISGVNNYVTITASTQKTNPQGGATNNGYVYLAKEDLEKAGFTTSIELVNNIYGSCVTGIKELDDGKRMMIKYYNASTTSIAMKVTVYDAYEEKENREWDNSIISKMKENFGGHTIPFFQTGKVNPTASFSNTNGFYSMTMNGGLFEESIYEDAKKAFEEDNSFTTAWTVSYNYTYDSSAKEVVKSLIATNTDKVTGKTLTVTLSYTVSGMGLRYSKVTALYF